MKALQATKPCVSEAWSATLAVRMVSTAVMIMVDKSVLYLHVVDKGEVSC